MQEWQKPNDGYFGLPGTDSRSTQFWAKLPGTTVFDDIFLIRDARSTNALRQCAELAHWFPSRSGPIGAQRLCSLLQTNGEAAAPGSCPIEDEDFTRYSAESRTSSHSSLVQQRFNDVWNAFGIIRGKLGF
jgi:hypothetical protein